MFLQRFLSPTLPLLVSLLLVSYADSLPSLSTSSLFASLFKRHSDPPPPLRQPIVERTTQVYNFVGPGGLSPAPSYSETIGISKILIQSYASNNVFLANNQPPAVLSYSQPLKDLVNIYPVFVGNWSCGQLGGCLADGKGDRDGDDDRDHHRLEKRQFAGNRGGGPKGRGDDRRGGIFGLPPPTNNALTSFVANQGGRRGGRGGGGEGRADGARRREEYYNQTFSRFRPDCPSNVTMRFLNDLMGSNFYQRLAVFGAATSLSVNGPSYNRTVSSVTYSDSAICDFAYYTVLNNGTTILPNSVVVVMVDQYVNVAGLGDKNCGWSGYCNTYITPFQVVLGGPNTANPNSCLTTLKPAGPATWDFYAMFSHLAGAIANAITNPLSNPNEWPVTTSCQWRFGTVTTNVTRTCSFSQNFNGSYLLQQLGDSNNMCISPPSSTT